MTTLAQLADRAQNALSDAAAGTWSQATVEEWCIDALRDLSQHQPRVVGATYTPASSSTGAAVSLTDDDLLDIITVEYPISQTPTEYLKRWNYGVETFPKSTKGYYMLKPSGDETVSSILLISETSAGGDVTLTYTARHDLTISSGNDITARAEHENALIAFVVWRAFQELVSAEQQSPTSASALLSSQFGENSMRARRHYYDELRRLQSSLRTSEITSWSFDKWD